MPHFNITRFTISKIYIDYKSRISTNLSASRHGFFRIKRWVSHKHLIHNCPKGPPKNIFLIICPVCMLTITAQINRSKLTSHIPFHILSSVALLGQCSRASQLLNMPVYQLPFDMFKLKYIKMNMKII